MHGTGEEVSYKTAAVPVSLQYMHTFAVSSKYDIKSVAVIERNRVMDLINGNMNRGFFWGLYESQEFCCDLSGIVNTYIPVIVSNVCVSTECSKLRSSFGNTFSVVAHGQ